MAFAATDSTKDKRAFSVGGSHKAQILTYTAISGDTSGTVTCDMLTNARHILIDGSLALTAAPTFSGNVVTLAFNDPAANVFGTIMVLGN